MYDFDILRDRTTFESKLLTKDPKTQRAYKNTLDSFEAYLAENNLTLNEENVEDIVQAYINWFNHNHSPNTVWNYYSRIKKYLRHLKFHIDEIELPAKHEKELYPLKLSDIHLIFEGMDPKQIRLFLTQIQTGIRIGEAVQLRKRHFVYVNGRMLIKIPPQIAKFKRGRTVVVGKESASRVKVRLKEIEDNDLVFGSSDNVHSSEVSKEEILRKQLIKHGLDMKYEDTGRYQINTHSFRAYFITRVSRHDPNIAKKLAGEKGYLLQYDRLSDEELIKEYERFESDLMVFDLVKRDNAINYEQKTMKDNLRKQDEKIQMQQDEIQRLTHAVDYLMKKEKSKEIKV